MLAVSTRLAPDDWSSLIIDRLPFYIDMFAVALHIKLLQICAETIEILIIRQNSYSFSTEEVIIPDTNQSKKYRQIVLEWGPAKMLVHLMETGQHLAEAFRPDSDHEREADG